ncbi:POT family protein [Phlyctema vagabunda]|uniref:POT family protein n=1 Tax=Phlyctema vagabunda TaxID=108571 RepID=A0ABR4P6D5_9HELO
MGSNQPNVLNEVQIAMGSAPAVAAPTEKGLPVTTGITRQSLQSNANVVTADGDAPTAEEKQQLRAVAGKMPITAYLLCAVEFAERASWYGSIQVFGNFVNRPLPAGGNGAGAPAKGTQDTAGALGKGTAVANAIKQSYQMIAYVLPILGGWLADTKTGRFKMVCYGVVIFGVAHIVLIFAAIPSVLQSGNAFGPFALGVYMLAVGAAAFKPNISPMLLDQNPYARSVVSTLPSGERVVIDAEATTERIMLWFYLLINIGGFFGVATSYLAKYVGFWSSFLLPTIIYMLLPPLLWWLHPRLILKPPGGSELGKVVKVVKLCFSHGGFFRIGRTGFWERAKPTFNGRTDLPWDDQFVVDVQRTFQAAGIFCFFPVFNINDGGLGAAADALSVMLTTNGVPNDLLNNLNPLIIIFAAPCFNYGIYPFLRRRKIHFGPIKRIFTGLLLCSIFSVGWPVITHYAYKTSPCGNHASSLSCVDEEGNSLVSPISIWVTAIPVMLTAVCEILVNVTAYGLAYSRAPKNMRGLVSALNLFSTGVSYAIGLGTSYVIQDPYIVWAFGGPTIIGFVLAFVFWFVFRDLDKEEYILSEHMKDDHDHTALPEIQETKGRSSGSDAASEEKKIAM